MLTQAEVALRRERSVDSYQAEGAQVTLDAAPGGGTRVVLSFRPLAASR